MEDQTTPPFVQDKPLRIKKESQLFGLSIRGLVVIMVVGTVCYMSLRIIEVKEPLYTLAGLTIGYYFGQNQKPQHIAPK